MNLSATVSALELVWTVGAAYGLFKAVQWLFRALIDKRDLLHMRINGRRELAARVNIAIGACVSVSMLMKLGIGLIALAVAPPEGGVTWRSVVIGFAFVVSELSLIVMMHLISKVYEDLVILVADLAKARIDALRDS